MDGDLPAKLFDKSQLKTLQNHNHHFENTYSESCYARNPKEGADPPSNNKRFSLYCTWIHPMSTPIGKDCVESPKARHTKEGVDPPSQQQNVLSLLHMDPPRERTHRGRIILRI
eukprot:c25276_g3_i22 orf=171-512(+)